MKSFMHTMLWRKRADGICRLLTRAGLTLLLLCNIAGARGITTNGFKLIDLSPHGLSAEEAVTRQLSPLPNGLRVFNDVPFQVAAPIALAGIESARIADVFPLQVSNIQVGAAARRIHLLHSTLFAEKDGALLATVIFRYADGSQGSVRLGYGIHARAWVTPEKEKRAELFDLNSRLAWAETDERRSWPMRLFQTAIENPKPNAMVASIELVSLLSHAAPLIAAITIETPEAKATPQVSGTARKVMRDLNEHPDSVYRRELTVRVTDDSGTRLTNATASLSITDDKEGFFLDSTPVDVQGLGRLAYSPLHAVGVTIWVHAQGFMPAMIYESKTNVAKFAENYAVKLERGTTIGGVVKNAHGQPVATAEIVIYRAARISPHHYSRVDFDIAKTDANGKWTSASLPNDLSGLGFQVAHPEYRPGFVVTAGIAPPPGNSSSSPASSSTTATLRELPDGSFERVVIRQSAPKLVASTAPVLDTNALRASTAEIVLQPAIVVSGVALDSAGKPLVNVPVILQQTSPASARKYLRSDGEGKFRTTVGAPGSGTLHLVLENQSPKFVAVNIAPGMTPVELRLDPPRVMRGRVQDRNGRPVEGARVRVDQWQGTTDLVNFSAVTDELGAFVWNGAASGQVTFYATKTNYSNSRASFSGTMDNITITMTRPAGIYGRVYDAETKEPIDSFIIVPGRKYSSNEKRINWDRSESLRGTGGEYALRLSSYYFQPEARVLVEAPGYEPQISRPFNGVDGYTNDFALKRGKGPSGIVLLPNGSPAAGATLVIIEKGESGYMSAEGQLRANGATDMVRSDAKGRFEFPAKLEPQKIFASHDEGFGEVKVSELASTGKVALQKWGRIKGVNRVGERTNDAVVRLTSNYEYVYDPEDGRGTGFSFSFKAEPAADGSFIFEKVPPGEHRVALEYRFKDDRYGDAAWSHGFFVDVKPGLTAEANLGGTGRCVVGRVNLKGGDHSDVDWARDVHRLILMLPPLAGQPNAGRVTLNGNEGFSVLTRMNGPAVDPQLAKERQRAERTYVLLFDTNGNFHADNIPPGKYQLMVNVTDPEDEVYNRRSIGAMNMDITVPDEKNAKVNAPFNIGPLELAIRPRLRIGKPVPSFEGKTSAGKLVKFSDLRGKPVLLHFWGLSLGYNTTELNILKELHSMYGEAGKLVILGCNLDAPNNNPQQFAQRQGLVWTQLYLGQWDQTPVPGMFGLNGSTGCVLIDGEGKVASTILRSSAIRNAVQEALEGE